jgi:hypothetical protein
VPQQEQILFVGFNQDQGCFTLGTSKGFRIFNSHPFKDTFHRGKLCGLPSPCPILISQKGFVAMGHFGDNSC